MDQKKRYEEQRELIELDEEWPAMPSVLKQAERWAYACGGKGYRVLKCFKEAYSWWRFGKALWTLIGWLL